MTAPAAGRQLTVGIFGSCVSRDLCEHMPELDVACYVARQSSIVRLGPYGAKRAPVAGIDSKFQARVYAGDHVADCTDRLTAAQPDFVLVDVIDERRGVWCFPDGTYLTNSIEAYRTGVDKWGPAAGARLIEFGDDEHFDLWREGFAAALAELRGAGLPCVLVDIAWAELLDGEESSHPIISAAGRIQRKAVRAGREAKRVWARGEGIAGVIGAVSRPPEPVGEESRENARRANVARLRYSAEAARHVDAVVALDSDDVRMDPDHQWGLAPYHYRACDYLRIADALRSTEVVRTLQMRARG